MVIRLLWVQETAGSSPVALNMKKIFEEIGLVLCYLLVFSAILFMIFFVEVIKKSHVEKTLGHTISWNDYFWTR